MTRLGTRAVVLGLGAALVGVACKDVTFGIKEPPDQAPKPVPKGVTKVDITPPTDTADGTSAVTIKVTVDTLPRPSDNRVTLTTTVGTFLGATTTVTVPVNDSGLAYAQVRAPAEESSGLISATAAGVTQYAAITFVAAPPTRVQLTTSDFVLKAGPGNTVTLTAQLLRPTGTPSPGDTVTFSAVAGAASSDVGQFIPKTVVSTSNTVTTRFSVADTSFRGPVTAQVTVTRGPKVRVSDSISLLAVP